jgi:predicted hotdog family 3-hydroxylacyl-ACP dehydratase
VPEADFLLDRLPHRGLARIPDAIVELLPGVRVVARFHVLATDVRLNPDGRLPAVLLVEMMAQAGGLLLEPGVAPPGQPPALAGPLLLAGVRRMHLHDTPRAGETVLATCRLVRRLGRTLLVEGRAATTRLLAHGTLHLSRPEGGP